jgi:3-oxoacyl-[acyl-carrier-protein] synthase-3
VKRVHGEFADDMQVTCEDGSDWWEPTDQPFYINFTEKHLTKVIFRGNRMVPNAIRDVCKEADLKPGEIDLLITNQPNPFFLRNWREAAQVSSESHVDTFEEHGNLFGAAMPISFERAWETGKVKPGDHIVFAGFSHAGDYAGAAVVQWKPGKETIS